MFNQILEIILFESKPLFFRISVFNTAASHLFSTSLILQNQCFTRLFSSLHGGSSRKSNLTLITTLKANNPSFRLNPNSAFTRVRLRSNPLHPWNLQRKKSELKRAPNSFRKESSSKQT